MEIQIFQSELSLILFITGELGHLALSDAEWWCIQLECQMNKQNRQNVTAPTKRIKHIKK